MRAIPLKSLTQFANPFASRPPDSILAPQPRAHYLTPDQVLVLSTLAKQFALCDRWFASAPCQTWPNRWFVHAGPIRIYWN